MAGSATATTAAVTGGAAALAAAVSTGGLGAGVSYLSRNVSTAMNSGVVQNVTTAANDGSGTGFNSFSQLKSFIGSPGSDNQWHHIVEQCQISKTGFLPQMIHNTNNIVPVSTDIHRMISGYYSSIQPFTEGLTVRNWLAGQSFDAQYSFGVEVIRMFLE